MPIEDIYDFQSSASIQKSNQLLEASFNLANGASLIFVVPFNYSKILLFPLHICIMRSLCQNLKLASHKLALSFANVIQK